MTWVINLISIPLGYIMYLCYRISGSYGASILLFTLLSKLILFPLSLSVQKNSIRMAKIQPQLDEIKIRYAGDKDRIAEEQIKLYDGEKYSPAKGCLPTLIQLPLILGLIGVIYNPLKYLLRLNAAVINQLMAATEALLGGELTVAAQLRIIDAVHASPAAFAGIPDLAAVQAFNMNFLGLNLGLIPSFTAASVLVPLLSGLSCLAMCLIQNKINVLQREQGALGQWGMTIFLVAFSTYFPFVVPTGVGLYWIFSNLFSIVVMLLVNLFIDPRKYIDYSRRPHKQKPSAAEKKAARQLRQELRAREKVDVKRFDHDDADPKQLVFYSAKSGFYKYFENIIEHILVHSELVIHYVTSDPDDAIFKKQQPRIVPYYVGEKALIPFMMKMDADMVVMTMPDLQKYHIKRSLVRKDIEYVYVFHTVASMHMTLREGAVDHYDTVFCVGPHQVREIRKTEELEGLPPKRLIECGYGVIDNLLEAYHGIDQQKDKPQILIAPSWQADNLLELCLDPILNGLVGRGWKVIVRPHPEFIKRFPAKMEGILETWGDKLCDDFIIELDFSSNATIYQSDLLITDWSNIAFEFSYCSKRPTIFINTPMKVMNPNYEDLEIVPLDIVLRDEVGVSVDVDQLERLGELVIRLLDSGEQYKNKIEQIVQNYLYNVGHSGQVGGNYIIKALKNKTREDEEEEK